MVGGGDAESGVGHSLQEEVADLQRQVCPLAVHDIPNMNLFHCYALNPLAYTVVCETLSHRGRCC